MRIKSREKITQLPFNKLGLNVKSRRPRYGKKAFNISEGIGDFEPYRTLTDYTKITRTLPGDGKRGKSSHDAFREEIQNGGRGWRLGGKYLKILFYR